MLTFLSFFIIITLFTLILSAMTYLCESYGYDRTTLKTWVWSLVLLFSCVSLVYYVKTYVRSAEFYDEKNCNINGSVVMKQFKNNSEYFHYSLRQNSNCEEFRLRYSYKYQKHTTMENEE